MPDVPSEVRLTLRALGERRARHLTNGEALAGEIRATAKLAQSAGIPMAEVARLLDIDRSTLYRVYLDAESGGP